MEHVRAGTAEQRVPSPLAVEGVVATEAGALLLGFAARALREVDDGIAMLQPGGGGLTGRLRIGATHTFNISLIPECVALFLDRHPTMQIQIEELSAGGIGERLAALGYDGELADAMRRWSGNENLEERVDGVERIDPVVLRALREAG